MTYTINGKEYSELGINQRCAELIKPKHSGYKYVKVLENYTPWRDILEIGITSDCCVIKYLTISKPNMDMWSMYDACNSPTHTWPIINKCWDELNKVNVSYDSTGRMITSTKWNSIMIGHNCSKLIAACICYIEINEAAL